FDDEDDRRTFVGPRQARRRQRRDRVARAKRQHSVERASLAQGARYAYRPTLRLGQPLAQRKPEPGTGVLLGDAGVELLEFDEQTFEIRGRDADPGIFDTEPEVRPVVGDLRADNDTAARLGKLQRVGNVVVENLLQPGSVDDDGRH